mmetsp:Transcript_19055/g.53105  ORF Transcript_19055/g.53105 Transcript_19055/m.53105 type:complete len:128 (-) Transcript_19055:688-1071(-)
MRWSKNVHEEQDCPKQLLMASMNPQYCVYLGLATFLEMWLSTGAGRVSQWLFAEGDTTTVSPLKDQDNETLRCKNTYQRAIKAIIESQEFRPEGMCRRLGTHSVKKWGTTMARQGGATKDNVNYRAQ